MPEPHDLVGLFVIEVGTRQAWPFIQFCDNAPTPPREVRLYVDTMFTVDFAGETPVDEALDGLLGLNNLSVLEVESDDGLSISFNNGSRLRVSGQPQAWTIGDVWWLSPWLC